ncbi:protein FAR1-RELATED SEQUENCE 5-like [Olea europaea var. sylvestris]|uniref:protein FAR1-RELATED SEQUENCE 5-like n=1 Tax=Olea europaea var. sylvestris TaxID=158386 RepID=UPI000C1CF460|nr:protein FAR1-RELATED SEQUENCE 5-like [Olea europaea var. sylvestris]
MEDGNPDLLLQSDNENAMENLNMVDNENVGEDVALVPKVGMTFSDEKEIFYFYKKYAYAVGFSVRKRNSKKGGRWSYEIYSLGIWRINKVYLDHNHKTSPSKSRLYQCNRKLSESVKRKLEVNDMAGIPLHKSYNSAIVEAGRYENTTFVEKDCRNYIEQMMTADQRMFFWADNRYRQSYREFGDAVTFDTTYLTNKYDMPFVPFVGVNHHGQSTLLSYGLLSNEDTGTFAWLFRTSLECMHGQAPNAIIADQDRAMQNAIQITLLNTKHRWCLWHIMKKLPEKFGYHIEKSSIFYAIHGLVYDAENVQEFERGWRSMLDMYDLHDNAWLSGVYENRGRWVPCFLKTTFWADMSTTQRSESMNAFFDGYVHSKTSLKQFVEQYERALRNKVEKEFRADFRSYSQMVPCATTYEMEKQFQVVYTIEKFKEIQQEFTEKV